MSTPEIVFESPIEGGIVVGHDGSGPSDRALAWAVREAVAHGSPLHVLRAWTLATAAAQVNAPFGVVPSFDECAAAVREETLQAVDAALAAAGDPPLDVRVHVVHAAAGPALVAASRTADVVIVGHRGHGGGHGGGIGAVLGSVLESVLGSVAEHVLRDAECPVAVLRTG
jgi:nucleotide-binding universal stress UspA family protein